MMQGTTAGQETGMMNNNFGQAAQPNKGFQFQQGVRENRGQVALDNGAIYEGEWLNEQRDGYGVQKWLDGSRHEGQGQNGKANG